ncbi:hypothetical protein IC575_011073 [Cucumis melo]
MSSLRLSFISTLQLDSVPKYFTQRRSPRLSISTSSIGLEVTEKASLLSFLNRRESGLLQFVQYHGLDEGSSSASTTYASPDGPDSSRI